MAGSSSAKKVARLAQKSRGRKARFQGGTLFPAVMGAVIFFGLILVTYSRELAPNAEVAPTVDDHWRISYGFYACDQFLGDLEGHFENETPVDEEYAKYGIHSHDDGVIHWHPRPAAAGTKAKLGVFLDTYRVKVSSDGIEFPPGQNEGKSYKVDTDKCKDENGKDVEAQVQVIVWDSHDDPGSSQKYITDFDNIRLDRDLMAITIAFAPAGAEIPLPPSAEDLLSIPASEDAILAGATPTTVAATTTTVATDTTGG